MLTPRQLAFIGNYCKQGGATFGNAYRSAIKAGYGEGTAKHIMAQLPEKVEQKIVEGLDEKGIQKEIVEKLRWLTRILSDPAERKRTQISDTVAIRGLELLGRWLKMFSDRTELSGDVVIDLRRKSAENEQQ